MSELIGNASRKMLVAGLCIALAFLTSAANFAGTPPTTRSPGQSATLLADGSWLVLGGREESGRVSGQAVLVDGTTQQRQVLEQTLNVPRAGHSATVLPDGTVLVIGGIGASGQPVAELERYHPDTRQFENLGDVGIAAVSGQSATVLSDGRLLVVGGTDVSSLVHNDAQLFDPTTLRPIGAAGGLSEARSGQQAQLLPSGDVLVWGGRSQSGQTLSSAELYDVAAGRFEQLDSASAAVLLAQDSRNSAPTIAATLPQSESANVTVDARLALRFSKPLQPGSLTDQTVTLLGPSGSVPVTVTAAEGGLLAFVTPKQQLLPGSRYTLFVQGAQDGNRALPFTAVGFQTTSLTVQPVPKRAAAAAPQLLDAGPDDADGELWIPGKHNMTGVWRSGQARLARKHLAKRSSVARALREQPLKSGLPDAPRGVTALAGQVLLLNGTPLARVTLSLGAKKVTTDSNGEFLLADVPAGAQTLIIDGATADAGQHHYGRYEYRASIDAGKTNALPFVIWMTRLDTRHAVTIPSPTTSPAVLTNPAIPGLELDIPAGTVIRDSKGNIVTQLTMTAIPVDQPPFPLPNHLVPVYFTIQPGGAQLQGLTLQSAQGARLVYPNFGNSAAGARIDFWNYDAHEKGWYVYGQGTVSADRKQIIPDSGVVIYEFTGAMIGLPGDGPGDGPPGGGGAGSGGGGDPGGGGGGGGGGSGGGAGGGGGPGGDGGPGGGGGDPGNGGGSGGGGGGGCQTNGPAQAGDPVDCFTGLFVYDRTDMVVRDALSVEVHRTYRPRDTASRSFGIGTLLSYDMYLVGDISPWTYQDLVLPNGGRVHYTRTSSGTSYSDAVYRTATPGRYFGSTIHWNGAAADWLMQFPNGAVYTFPENEGSSSARCGATNGMRDRYGNNLTFVRDGNCNLISVTSPNGRRIAFSYDTSNRITQASDDIGRAVTYHYDSSGRLSSVTDPTANSESYTYDSSNGMLTVTDRRGNLKLSNTYDANERVIQQSYADSTSSSFNYTLNASGVATQMDYTDTRGVVKRVLFNAAGYPTSVTRALGKPEQRVTSFVRDPVTNLAQSVTDALGRVTSYQYDANGNVTQVTSLSGTSAATTWNYTYDPVFSRLTSATDPAGHTSTYAYDSFGNKTAATDPLGDTVTLTYNAAGQVTSSTSYVGGTPLVTSFAYNGGDLLSTTDPLNRTVQYFTDDVGRVITVQDAIGNRTTTVYDAVDRPTQMTDPLGNTVQYTYDGNGNLLTVRDPRVNVTSFTYDSRNHLASMTDALGHAETYAYDPIGNRIKWVDRKGQVSGFGYDFLNRMTSAGYGASTVSPTAYTSTIAYTWDAGNRLTQLVDSQSGTITRTFDGLDRLSQEQSPQGQVNYAYYANGLRQSMTVLGQAAVAYTYDNASRLTQIARGGATVGFAYDGASRRTLLTLPNGIQVSYAYDSASDLTGLTYQNGATTLGTLTYSYDAAGRRTAMGGTLARVALPAPVTSAAYDAVNRVTSWGPSTLTYDNDGNLIVLGTSTFGFDPRNRLVATSDGAGSFAYDALGRRTGRTVSGTTNTYLYDGSSPVTVNSDFMLGGLGLDEIYARISTAGATSYLADALGNTLELTDSTGAATANYSYEPYGAASETGSDDTSFRFTGREDDGASNLDYFRARYYSAKLGRFISSDPLGLAGGVNSYAYARGNPVSFADPSGLWTVNVGVTISFQLGFISGSYTVGVVADGTGNVGTYANPYVGAGVGGEASVGIVVGGSNAPTINDLNGPFAQATANAGLGPDVSGTVYAGNANDGSPVVGGEVGIGVGIGAGGSGGGSYTVVSPGIHIPSGGGGPNSPCQ